MPEDNDMLCPWCLGELPGKPGQVAKCRHCGSDIHWGDGKPYKTKFQAAQPNPVVRDVPVRMRPAPTTPIQQTVEPEEQSFVVENASEILNDLSSYETKISEKKVANEKVNQALQRNIKREREVWIVLAVAVAIAFLAGFGIWYQVEINLPSMKVSEEIDRFGTWKPNPFVPLNKDTWRRLIATLSEPPSYYDTVTVYAKELDMLTVIDLVDVAQRKRIPRLRFPSLAHLDIAVARKLLELNVGEFDFGDHETPKWTKETAKMWLKARKPPWVTDEDHAQFLESIDNGRLEHYLKAVDLIR